MKAHSFSLSLRGQVCYRKSALPVVVAAAHAAAGKLPPAEASLMREVATRLDVTFAALTESMDQRMSLDAEINHLRQESVQ